MGDRRLLYKWVLSIEPHRDALPSGGFGLFLEKLIGWCLSESWRVESMEFFLRVASKLAVGHFSAQAGQVV